MIFIGGRVRELKLVLNGGPLIHLGFRDSCRTLPARCPNLSLNGKRYEKGVWRRAKNCQFFSTKEYSNKYETYKLEMFENFERNQGFRSDDRLDDSEECVGCDAIKIEYKRKCTFGMSDRNAERIENQIQRTGEQRTVECSVHINCLSEQYKTDTYSITD